MNRRTALTVGTVGVAGSTLAINPEPKAKSIIQIWMWGGSSHLDTFDPKHVGVEYTGAYTTPIKTNVDGIEICQMLPEMAKIADKYSIIRGMTHGINAHETASYVTQTGFMDGDGISHPCIGSVVSHQLGFQNGYTGLIPPYIVLTKPQGRFSESGFLGLSHRPFATGGDPSKIPFTVEGIISKGITEKRQWKRRELRDKLDTIMQTMDGNEQLKRMGICQDQAYELILGGDGKVFDLSREPESVRDMYGKTTFGQSCLVACRLAEAGVKYITINYNGWDTHKKHFEEMQRKLPEFDAGCSALLNDLERRGLLSSTIVWAGGEFGRTPKIDWDAPWNGGRSHYGKAFSHILAGGGFSGGHVVGSTDKYGNNVVDRPVYPWDLLRSIYIQLGIDPKLIIYIKQMKQI